MKTRTVRISNELNGNTKLTVKMMKNFCVLQGVCCVKIYVEVFF